MSFRHVVLVFVLLLGSVPLVAQRGGGGLTGARETPLPAIGQPLSLIEQFQQHLRLDATQIPAVDEILQAASRQAAPIGQAMSNTRMGLVNAELRNEPDSAKQLLAEYQLEAAKMAAVETEAFQKIAALLKPDQQKRAEQAFDVMAGMFLPPRPRSAGAPGSGRPTGGGR
ncbi:MAG: hypothetical protein IT184_15300 [Acidobacteria bacterium]|nr:hypothetical protein [Acidobacteriota bacterium]